MVFRTNCSPGINRFSATAILRWRSNRDTSCVASCRLSDLNSHPHPTPVYSYGVAVFILLGQPRPMGKHESVSGWSNRNHFTIMKSPISIPNHHSTKDLPLTILLMALQYFLPHPTPIPTQIGVGVKYRALNSSWGFTLYLCQSLRSSLLLIFLQVPWGSSIILY